MIVAALALVVHGLGHSMDILESWGIVQMKPGAYPSGYLGRLGVSDIVVKAVGSLFAIVMVRFLSVAIGFWQGLTWWRPLSIGLSAFYH